MLFIFADVDHQAGSDGEHSGDWLTESTVEMDYGQGNKVVSTATTHVQGVCVCVCACACACKFIVLTIFRSFL